MSQPTVAALDNQVIAAGPLVLPPERRMMSFLLLALTALLHLATSGWGPIENGRDGMNAAIARELAVGLKPSDISQMWSQPVEATPGQWLTMKSFQIFNVSEWSARLPFAAANLLIVGFVYLIAERMGGVWRGLASGIMAATTSGPILHGRDGGGAALTALLLTIAFYAAVRMLEQRSQARWQFLFWGASAGEIFLKTPAAAILLIAGCWVAFGVFREARIRLRLPWWIGCNLSFLGLLVFFGWGNSTFVPNWETANAGRYLWMLFPWSVVMLLPLFFRFRKIFRASESTPQETLLWFVFGMATVWVLFFPEAGEWPVNVACLVPIFATLASLIWDRLNYQNRMAGVGLLVLLAISGMGFCGRVAGKDWLNLLRPIWWLSSGVIIVFGISAMIALYLRHSRAALLTIAASTIPLAYNLLDARARFDWQNTFRELGQKVDVGYQPGTQIVLEGDLVEASSFLFYAPRGLPIRRLDSHSPTNIVGRTYLLVHRGNLTNWPGATPIGKGSDRELLLLPGQ